MKCVRNLNKFVNNKLETANNDHLHLVLSFMTAIASLMTLHL